MEGTSEIQVQRLPNFRASESPGEFVTLQTAAPHLQNARFCSSGRRTLRIYISNKFPDDADAVGLWTTF